MTLKLIATVGDEETQEDAHFPPVGGDTYSINPDDPKNKFVYVNNKLVLVDGDQFDAHGTATLVASTNLLFIGGNAVIRDEDEISHHHSNSGVQAIQNDFVRCK